MVQELFEFVPGITIDVDQNTTSTKKKFRSRRPPHGRGIRRVESKKRPVLHSPDKLFLDNGLYLCYNIPLKNRADDQEGEMGRENVVEWFVANRGYWRTGIYIRTIERGRRFGWIEIAPTGGLPKPRIKLKPDHVRPFKPAGKGDKGTPRTTTIRRGGQ
jgi:hypothetical protein